MVEGNHCIGICHHLRNLVRREEPRMTEHLENIDSRWCGRDAGPLSYIRCWTFSTNTGWWDSCLLKQQCGQSIPLISYDSIHPTSDHLCIQEKDRPDQSNKCYHLFIYFLLYYFIHSYHSSMLRLAASCGCTAAPWLLGPARTAARPHLTSPRASSSPRPSHAGCHHRNTRSGYNEHNIKGDNVGIDSKSDLKI